MNDKNILEKFLSIDLTSPQKVFTEFKNIDNAIYFPTIKGYDDCIYVPGHRNDRVVLVSHADTVFSKKGKHRIILENGTYKSNEQDDETGIGADDRAGVAILYLLKDLGHSLLITNGEERGCLGAHAIREHHTKLFDELNNHQYFIEFDRCHSHDFKTYTIPVTEDFKRFIEQKTSFKEAEPYSSTDITILCEKICGVNLSIGYDYEHTPDEILAYKDWKRTLDIVRKMLEEPQKKFPLLTNLKGDLTC